jgi:hypothetical protein
VTALLLLWCSTAQAEVTLDLDWQVPAGCPSADVVQQRVRSIAGTAWSRAERLHAKGRIVRSRRRYRLTLTIREGGDERERTMESDSCNDLAGATAVVLGLLLRHEPESDAVDKTSEAATAPQAPAGKPASPPESSAADPQKSQARNDSSSSRRRPGPANRATRPEAPPERSSSSKNAVDSERGVRFFVRAPELTLGFGALPGTSLGLGASVGLRLQSWHLGVRGRILGDRTLWASEPAWTGVDVSRAEVLLEVCRGFRSSRLELAPCVASGIERLSAGGAGTDVVARSSQVLVPVFAASGSAHLYVLDQAALVASAGLRIHAIRPEFLVDGFGSTGRLGAGEIYAGLGSEWIF